MDFVKKIFNRKNEQFFTLFEEVRLHLIEMNSVFCSCLKEEDAVVMQRMVKKLEELEHANDITTHKLFIELGRNFMTPYDREDIHGLAVSLDDIADDMYTIAKQRIVCGITKLPDSTHLIIENYTPVIAIVAEMLSALRKPKSLLKLSVMSTEAKRILNDCEDMIDNSLSLLFSSSKREALESIKLSDHYNYLQALINKSKDALNVMESIFIKYS